MIFFNQSIAHYHNGVHLHRHGIAEEINDQQTCIFIENNDGRRHVTNYTLEIHKFVIRHSCGIKSSQSLCYVSPRSMAARNIYYTQKS